MNALLLVARAVLGLVFIVSGWSKIHYPWIFARALLAYGLVPENLVTVIAIVLPWLELLAGLALLLGYATKGSATIVFSLCLVFIIVISSALWRGLDVSCGCLEGTSWSKVRWAHIVVDFVLSGLAFLLIWRGPGRWSVDKIVIGAPETNLSH